MTSTQIANITAGLYVLMIDMAARSEQDPRHSKEVADLYKEFVGIL